MSSDEKRDEKRKWLRPWCPLSEDLCLGRACAWSVTNGSRWVCAIANLSIGARDGVSIRAIENPEVKK